jgi:hypothetical protein
MDEMVQQVSIPGNHARGCGATVIGSENRGHVGALLKQIRDTPQCSRRHDDIRV